MAVGLVLLMAAQVGGELILLKNAGIVTSGGSVRPVTELVLKHSPSLALLTASFTITRRRVE